MSEEWCTHGPSLNCKDCEIERLEADAENLRNTITSTHLSLKERDAEIERLRVVVDAAQQLVEQGLLKRTTRDQWNAWHILKDALEGDDE